MCLSCSSSNTRRQQFIFYFIHFTAIGMQTLWMLTHWTSGVWRERERNEKEKKSIDKLVVVQLPHMRCSLFKSSLSFFMFIFIVQLLGLHWFHHRANRDRQRGGSEGAREREREKLFNDWTSWKPKHLNYAAAKILTLHRHNRYYYTTTSNTHPAFSFAQPFGIWCFLLSAQCSTINNF